MNKPADIKEKSPITGLGVDLESVKYVLSSNPKKGYEKIIACALFTKCPNIGSHRLPLQ